MRPTGAELARRQWTARTVLRVAGLALLGWSVYPVASWLAEGLTDDDLWTMGYYAVRLVTGLMAAGAGIGVLVLAAPIARWATRPAARASCPACGYHVGEADRCPECGLDLASPAQGGWRRERVVWVVGALGRAWGAYLLLLFVCRSPALAWYAVVRSPAVFDDGMLAMYILYSVADGAAGFALLVLSPGLARLLVGREPVAYGA